MRFVLVLRSNRCSLIETQHRLQLSATSYYLKPTRLRSVINAPIHMRFVCMCSNIFTGSSFSLSCWIGKKISLWKFAAHVHMYVVLQKVVYEICHCCCSQPMKACHCCYSQPMKACHCCYSQPMKAVTAHSAPPGLSHICYCIISHTMLH